MPAKDLQTRPAPVPSAPMHWWIQHGKRAFRIVVAFTLIAIGALLGLVPGIPGWPLALLALSLLAVDFVWAHRLKTKIETTAKNTADKLRGKSTPSINDSTTQSH
jgi:flagellar biosynthesis component FlhA